MILLRFAFVTQAKLRVFKMPSLGCIGLEICGAGADPHQNRHQRADNARVLREGRGVSRHPDAKLCSVQIIRKGNLRYTDANKNSGLTWDEATFTDYIKDPRAKIPGTKMVYAGLKDEQRVKDIIAFLKQYDATGKKAP
jgi:hypothetical protein